MAHRASTFLAARDTVPGSFRECVGFGFKGVDDDAAGQAGEAAVETPRRFVDIGLHGEYRSLNAICSSTLAHTPPFRCPVPDPGNIETRHLIQHVECVVPACEPADRYRPIEADHTSFDRFFNIR